MIASQNDVLSDDVELYMKSLTSNRYYALNDRTIHLLMKGEIDMSAVTDNGSAEESDANKENDSEVQEWLDTETYVDIFVAGTNKARAGGAFFKY